MKPQAKQALFAAGRRVAVTALVLAGVWVVILLLRWAADSNTELIAVMTRDLRYPIGPEGIDWSTSLWTKRPVAEELAGRLGYTLRWAGLLGLFSLAVAGIALPLGVALVRATQNNAWLAEARQGLGLLLVNAWVTIPALVIGGGVAATLVAAWWGWVPAMRDGWRMWWPAALTPGLLPAGIMVQIGLGEMAKWRQQGGGSLATWGGLLTLKLVIALLRMTGGLLALAILAEGLFNVPGLGTRLVGAFETRDLPVALGGLWALAVTVALAKLAADLLGMAEPYIARRIGGQGSIAGSGSARGPGRAWLAVAAAVVLVPLVLGLGAGVFAPFSYHETHFADQLTPPGPTYRLGTDYLGRDMLSRILFGFRFSLLAALASTAIIFLPASAWGWLASRLSRRKGQRSGAWHDLLLLPAHILMAFPWVALGVVVALLFVRPGLWTAIMAVSLLLLPRATRMMEELYGSSPEVGQAKRVARSLLVMLPLAVGAALIYEVVISYVGHGIPPPYPDLGRMLAEDARLYMGKAPWLATWPMVALALLVLGWPLLGNTLAERFGFRSRAAWSKFME
ncbi:MAG: hypothetical protein HYY01_11835 [Chloroflexi bacterium]|nr:hypothetical protein [Chloroflexota bacterium]